MARKRASWVELVVGRCCVYAEFSARHVFWDRHERLKNKGILIIQNLSFESFLSFEVPLRIFGVTGHRSLQVILWDVWEELLTETTVRCKFETMNWATTATTLFNSMAPLHGNDPRVVTKCNSSLLNGGWHWSIAPLAYNVRNYHTPNSGVSASSTIRWFIVPIRQRETKPLLLHSNP